MNLIIGLGRVFWEYYYPNINKREYEFYDVNTSNLPDSLKYIDSFNDILDKEYDCIYILTPPGTHSEIIYQLYQNTKSFYIEKPVFQSFNEYKEVSSLSKEVYLLGGHSRRFFNNYRHFKKQVMKEAKTSQIENIAIREGSIYKWSPNQFMPILYDEAAHIIDSIFYILDYQDKNIEINNSGTLKSKLDYQNIFGHFIIDNIKTHIDISRVEDYSNQISIRFSNGRTLMLNTKLNGSMYFIDRPISYNIAELEKVSSPYQKQSSVSVFKEIIKHVESQSFINDNEYKLTKFYNTLHFVDKFYKLERPF